MRRLRYCRVKQRHLSIGIGNDLNFKGQSVAICYIRVKLHIAADMRAIVVPISSNSCPVIDVLTTCARQSQ